MVPIVDDVARGGDSDGVVLVRSEQERRKREWHRALVPLEAIEGGMQHRALRCGAAVVGHLEESPQLQLRIRCVLSAKLRPLPRHVYVVELNALPILRCPTHHVEVVVKGEGAVAPHTSVHKVGAARCQDSGWRRVFPAEECERGVKLLHNRREVSAWVRSR